MIRFIFAAIPIIFGLLLALFVLGLLIKIISGIASYIGGLFSTIIGLVAFYFLASFLLNACDIVTAIITSSLEGY